MRPAPPATSSGLRLRHSSSTRSASISDAEQVRAALAEHLRQAGLGERGEHRARVDRVVAADEHVGDLGERRATVGGRGRVRHHDRARRGRAVKNGCPGLEVEPRRDHGDAGLLGAARAHAATRHPPRRPAGRRSPRRAPCRRPRARRRRACGAPASPAGRSRRRARRCVPSRVTAPSRLITKFMRTRGVARSGRAYAASSVLAIDGAASRHRLCSRNAGSRQPSIASIMRIASTVSRTLCTRTMRAPCSTQ